MANRGSGLGAVGGGYLRGELEKPGPGPAIWVACGVGRSSLR